MDDKVLKADNKHKHTPSLMDDNVFKADNHDVSITPSYDQPTNNKFDGAKAANLKPPCPQT